MKYARIGDAVAEIRTDNLTNASVEYYPNTAPLDQIIWFIYID
jgi:hypothetical protein